MCYSGITILGGIKMHVSVRELKAHLSKYLHLVEAGEPVVVTSHDAPIARLIPFEGQELKAKKLGKLLGPSMQWNGKKPEGAKIMPRLLKEEASRFVLEDRR